MIQYVNVGLLPNDGTGDALRDAFILLNTNIEELVAKDVLLDADILEIENIIIDINLALSNKSNVGHTHLISDITGLQTILNSFLTISNYNIDITNINTNLQSIRDSIDSLGKVAFSNKYDDLDNIPTTFTPSAHTHTQSDIIDLNTALDNKLKVFHSNTTPGTNVTGVTSETILESVFIPANTFTIGSWFDYRQRMERLNRSNAATWKLYTNTVPNSLSGAVQIGVFNILVNQGSFDFKRRFSIQSDNLLLGYALGSLLTDEGLQLAIWTRYPFNTTVDNYLISTITPTLAANNCQTLELIITGKK